MHRCPSRRTPRPAPPPRTAGHTAPDRDEGLTVPGLARSGRVAVWRVLLSGQSGLRLGHQAVEASKGVLPKLEFL